MSEPNDAQGDYTVSERSSHLTFSGSLLGEGTPPPIFSFGSSVPAWHRYAVTTRVACSMSLFCHCWTSDFLLEIDISWHSCTVRFMGQIMHNVFREREHMLLTRFKASGCDYLNVSWKISGTNCDFFTPSPPRPPPRQLARVGGHRRQPVLNKQILVLISMTWLCTW